MRSLGINAPSVTATKGGAVNSGVGTNISNSTLKAGNITVNNDAANNVGITSVTASAGGVAGGGVLTAEGDVTSHAGNGSDSLDIETVSVTGSVAFSGAGIGVIANGNSTSEIDIGANTKINAAKDIYVSAQNTFSAATKTSADTASMIAALSATVLEKQYRHFRQPADFKSNNIRRRGI